MSLEIETICPMKPLRLPYRERLCKTTASCVIKGHTVCGAGVGTIPGATL